MSAQGQRYHPAALRSMYAGTTTLTVTGPYADTWAITGTPPASDGFDFVDLERARIPSAPSGARPVTRTAEYEVALSSCTSNGVATSGLPEFAQELSTQFGEMQSDAVVAAGGPQSDSNWAQCMRDHGFAAVSGDREHREQLLSDLIEEASHAVAAADGASGAALTHARARIDQARAAEDAAAIADADCRATAYRGYLAAVRPRVAAFREEHAAELAEVQRQWAELESQAEAARKQWNADYPDVAL